MLFFVFNELKFMRCSRNPGRVYLFLMNNCGIRSSGDILTQFSLSPNAPHPRRKDEAAPLEEAALAICGAC